MCKLVDSDFNHVHLCLHFFQVYQYMHETITVNGCPEYQARATAKVRTVLEIWLSNKIIIYIITESCK